jgi:LacI family transcriptional regulator
MPTPPKRKPTRPATLADVGREAGVSAMAASAVLNGARTSSRTAPETRERILKAAERLRYRPNAAARALADRRMNTLGVAAVFEGELNQYFLEVFNGVVEAAARHNQNTTVFTLHDWGRDAKRLAGFCDGRIDGLLLIAPLVSHESLEHLPDHTPVIALHANMPLPKSVNLESDEERGAFEMVNHLISLGHKRIMHLTGNRGLIGAERRIQGYQRALEAARLRRDDNLLVEAAFSTEAGIKALRQWLAKSRGKQMPEAIFCANDGIAMGCLEVLAAAGYKVPQEVSVVGFDDTIAARTTAPQLTTVRQPLRAMGGQAVEILLERIREHTTITAPQTVVFPTELVLRGSATPPPAQPVLVR